jgi:hypothetical protein
MTIYIKRNDREQTILTSFTVVGAEAANETVREINAGFAASGFGNCDSWHVPQGTQMFATVVKGAR